MQLGCGHPPSLHRVSATTTATVRLPLRGLADDGALELAGLALAGSEQECELHMMR
jgi:hypothetical protein